MEIRCRKGDCVHNTGCSCRAEAVKICKTTAECETFKKDDIKSQILVENGNIFEVAKELEPVNTRNVPLTCTTTSCLFNKHENCTANGIVVTDDIAGVTDCGACCSTYCES